MAHLLIPALLRKFTQQQDRVQIAGHTVREVLENLLNCYPTLKAILLDERGKLTAYLNIYLNDKDVRDSFEMIVKEDDELAFIPALSGG